MNTLIPYLVRIYHIPQTSAITKQFAQHLQTYLDQRYMAPLSYLNIYRARKELQLMKAILWRIKKGKYILRMTDKSGIFFILVMLKIMKQKSTSLSGKNSSLYWINN